MGVLDSFGLAGKRAVVTGATRGLGRAFAVALADAGADVAITTRDESTAEGVLADIADRGRRGLAVQGDVTVRADVERMTDEVLAAFGSIDVLVNNAGGSAHRPALQVPDEEFPRWSTPTCTGCGCAAPWWRGR